MTTAYAFDLDGTVTAQELLPLLADELGLAREMDTLTRLTLSGAIPFEDSFRLRCAILRAVPLSRVREVVAEAVLSAEVEAFIRARSDRCFVVTGNLDVWVAPLVERLGCRAFSSVAEVDGDRLTGVRSVLCKSGPVQGLKDRYDRVVAVGDSVNDIPMFESADVGVAFGGVHPPAAALVQVADYVTYREDALCRLLSTLS
jgi:phosphoserine phosphatase